MDIEKNTTYACRVVSINGEEVDYLSELVVDEEFITRITIKEVERKIYDKVGSETFVNIIVKYEAIYITVVDCQLVKRSYRMGSDCNESKINLEYMSFLMLLDYLWIPSQEIRFSGINCEITETTELLGVYPYQIDYDELTFPSVECDIKGNVVSKMVGHGFSYFVAPSITHEHDGLRVSMYGRIQYSSDKERNISEIHELLHRICLFFEILSGEIITIGDVFLSHDEHSIKTVGLCNFPKNKLNSLQSNFDTRSYLRKGLFKISDFEEVIGSAIAVFYRIQDECILAWDNINSNFRYKQYVPFVNESQNVISIQNRDNAESIAQVEVIAYTREAPVLREEYDNYALVQFISTSMWENLAGTIGNAETDTYVRALADAELSLEGANALETSVVNLIGDDYVTESENRIQEKVSNDEMMDGFMMIIGAFCVLLATIGIANVFSNTLGFIQQRKREFVQYMSIGMTEANIRKMFSIEALVIAGRPLLITLPLTIVFVGFMITASYLDLMEFLVEAPIFEISLFIVAIFVFVGLAYYLGGKKILNSDMAETLRIDTLV